MIKASIGLQELRRKIYLKAKAEPAWRFWGLFVHGRQGFGWKRWSSTWSTRLSSRVRKRLQLIGLISDEAKPSGKRSAGKPHAAFEEAGAGNGITVEAH